VTLRSLLLALVVLALLPAAVGLGWNEIATRAAREREVRDTALRHARLLAGTLDRIIDGGQQFVSSLAEMMALRMVDSDTCNGALRRLVDRFPQYVQLTISNADGTVICSGPSMGPLVSIADRAYFRTALRTGEFAVGDYAVGRLSGQKSLHFGHPLRDGQGNIVGLVGVAVGLDWLARTLAEQPLPPHANATVTDRNGTVLVRLASDEDEKVGKVLTEQQLKQAYAPAAGTTEAIDTDGILRLLGFVPLAASSAQAFYVSVGIDKHAAFAEIDAVFWRDLATIGIVLIVIWAAAWHLAEVSVRRPVRVLAAVAARWTAGDFGERARLSRTALEIGTLAHTFNRMAEAIGEREQALRGAKEEAEAASRTKTQFLANMSHELRTPLNAIIGFSEVIRDETFGPVPGRYAEYAASIHDAGRHLLSTINDILDISKIEAGRLELRDGPVDLQWVARACTDLVRGKAEDTSVTVEIDVADGLTVRGDEIRLKQVVLNLLSNAVKFSPAGGSVRLSASIESPSGEVTITVADSGIGMDPTEIRVALEPFGQVDSSLARRYEGTGLGLPLAKRLTELHGGRLDIESRKGNGTTVRVILPVERILIIPDAAADEPPLKVAVQR
jgi:signal transduction histidine kinase